MIYKPQVLSPSLVVYCPCISIGKGDFEHLLPTLQQVKMSHRSDAHLGMYVRGAGVGRKVWM